MTGKASIGGLAEYGLAKSYATGSGAGYYGLAQSGWTDKITFTNTALNGKKGFVTVAVDYSWSFAYTQSAPISLSAGAWVRAGNADAIVSQSPSVSCYIEFGCTTYSANTLNLNGMGGATTTSSGTVDASGAKGTMIARLPITFGEYTAWQISLSANVGNGSTGNWPLSEGSSHADHSLRWGGIVGVFDESGNEVAGYGLTSASGFNYRQAYVPAVPEPSTTALMVAGLAVSLGVARRRFQAGRA